MLGKLNLKYQFQNKYKLKQETKIQASSRGSRMIGSGSKAFWPDMESEEERQGQKSSN